MSKYCIQCGNKLTEGEKFCSNCGQKVNNSEPAFNNDNNNDIPPPPPGSSNNNYSQEEPYNEAPSNVNLNRANNSIYNENVVQTNTSSTNKFLPIILVIVTTLIVLSIGGYLYLKWKNIKETNVSSSSNTITNNDSKNNSSNSNDSKNTNTTNNSENINKDNTSSNNILSDDMIKEYISLADSTSLNLFKLASEAEQNGQKKQPFDSIRPLLQNCYSDALVNGELKPFYESELGQWTYELGMAFPFYTKAYWDQCSFTVIQRTESIIQVKIIDNNPEPLVYSTYTLKKYDKIWKIESIQVITND